MRNTTVALAGQTALVTGASSGLGRATAMALARAGAGVALVARSAPGGWANASAYCASKFALTGFTQALAAEAKAHGVRACVVYPGATNEAGHR